MPIRFLVYTQMLNTDTGMRYFYIPPPREVVTPQAVVRGGGGVVMGFCPTEVVTPEVVRGPNEGVHCFCL